MRYPGWLFRFYSFVGGDVVDILMRFYDCTKREPRFISTYTEKDGSVHSSTGSLFDR